MAPVSNNGTPEFHFAFGKIGNGRILGSSATWLRGIRLFQSTSSRELFHIRNTNSSLAFRRPLFARRNDLGKNSSPDTPKLYAANIYAAGWIARLRNVETIASRGSERTESDRAERENGTSYSRHDSEICRLAVCFLRSVFNANVSRAYATLDDEDDDDDVGD